MCTTSSLRVPRSGSSRRSMHSEIDSLRMRMKAIDTGGLKMGDKRSARNFQLPDYPGIGLSCVKDRFKCGECRHLPDYPGFGLSCAKDRFTLPSGDCRGTPPQRQPGELCLRSTPFLGMKDWSRGGLYMSSKVWFLALWVLGFVMENGFEHRDSHHASISQFTLLENRPFPGE